jgi:hypothetical protein
VLFAQRVNKGQQACPDSRLLPPFVQQQSVSVENLQPVAVGIATCCNVALGAMVDPD